jgi:hypothetical protein
MRVEHEEDDVGLIDDFVQHADVVSPLLFLRPDVESSGTDEMSLADAGETKMGHAHASVSQRC